MFLNNDRFVVTLFSDYGNSEHRTKVSLKSGQTAIFSKNLVLVLLSGFQNVLSYS